ncbi:MAG TPA: cytochrome c [Anaerolineae bacterium]|nr:cytochrome c [Anaerolineae bacterium]
MKSGLFVVFSVLVAGVLLLSACGGGGGAASQPTQPPAIAGNPDAGKTKFEGTCASCHGLDAKGLPNLGKDLTTSDFSKDLSDKDLVAFVMKGRSTSDPANTTGVDMPARGGNPALSETDMYDIVAYVRTLEK